MPPKQSGQKNIEFGTFLNFIDGKEFHRIVNLKQDATIDHKISIIDGYKKSISPEIIGGIDNLCFTKRTLNSQKNYMSEEDYLN